MLWNKTMWRYSLQECLKDLTPKFVITIVKYFLTTTKPTIQSDFVEVTKKQKTQIRDYLFDNGKKPTRKVPDRTKLSPKKIRTVKYWFREYSEGRLTGCHNRKELANFLNQELDLDKGVTAYAKIWSPKKTEES